MNDVDVSVHFLRCVRYPIPNSLNVSLYVSNRRAKIMRDVGDQLSAVNLILLPQLIGSLQLIPHTLKCLTKLSNFVIGGRFKLER
ncbi:hypothetical protein D3C74_410350 [compost metagenome]